MPLIRQLPPFLFRPGVPPPGRKGGGEARQALCGELIHQLLISFGLLNLGQNRETLTATLVAMVSIADFAAVIGPLAQDEQPNCVLPVNRCKRKFLGIVLHAVFNVLAAGVAEAV